ncbi:MAG: 50S ribosomal protein L24 [Candidatus Kaiserbacteria bacterium]|nr:50S ribosomal protein L24 [Candidatus Kaiserbacteria bacterium]
MKIKKGDKVKVISGKDKGAIGNVMRALPRENKVVIEGVAIYKRHLKGSAGKVGRIIERPRPVDVSNVKRVDSADSVKKESVFSVK